MGKLSTGDVRSTADNADNADKSFSRARREAVLRRTWAITRHSVSSVSLVSFEEARSLSGKNGRSEKVPLGSKDVKISRIVGSVSRNQDFDNLFLPLKGDLRYRWRKVYKEFQSSDILGREIVPITLYKIDDSYFVEDGNHRVSVARFRGRSRIRAEVTLLIPQYRQPL